MQRSVFIMKTVSAASVVICLSKIVFSPLVGFR